MARRPSRVPDFDNRGGRVWRRGSSSKDFCAHRIDGPAFEFGDGTKEWWEHDVCLRVDGNQGCYDTPDGVLVQKIRARHEAETEGMRQRIKDLEEYGAMEWWDSIRLRIEDERLKHG